MFCLGIPMILDDRFHLIVLIIFGIKLSLLKSVLDTEDLEVVIIPTQLVVEFRRAVSNSYQGKKGNR